MRTFILFLSLYCIQYFSFAQNYLYFEGDFYDNSIEYEILYDFLAPNIWQVGTPSKTLFNEASTTPNAIVTDTMDFIPNNNTSSFVIIQNMDDYELIGAIEWNQKLDLDSAKDFGIVEFSIDAGESWQNAFDSPFVYNYYGYEEENYMLIDSIQGSGFSGLDTNWRNIWLCFDYYYFEIPLHIKFTIETDSKDDHNEGWMMDNFIIHPTWLHTINETEQSEYMQVFPNVTTGRINIVTKKSNEKHLIENIKIFDISGKVMKEFGPRPTKTFIDIEDLSKGNYIMTVRTNLESETFQIILQ